MYDASRGSVEPTAEQIAKALGGAKKTGKGWLARCCCHEDSDPSLSLADGDDGTLLVHCFVGCASVDVLRELRRRGLLDGDDRRKQHQHRAGGTLHHNPSRQPTAEPTPADKLKFARTIWREAQSARGTLADIYCTSRDLELSPGGDLNDWLRFHPRLRHPTGIWLPGIVCLVRDPLTNAGLGIHRTFLTDQGGKTSLKPDRALLGGGGLGVIKIVADTEITTRVELVEGIESGQALLTAARRQGYMPPPIWAAVSASAFAKFPVLAGIETLVLHPDNDPAGHKAAQEVVERWADAAEVFIAANPHGKNWNDR